jgi:hypothetical protein
MIAPNAPVALNKRSVRGAASGTRAGRIATQVRTVMSAKALPHAPDRPAGCSRNSDDLQKRFRGKRDCIPRLKSLPEMMKFFAISKTFRIAAAVLFSRCSRLHRPLEKRPGQHRRFAGTRKRGGLFFTTTSPGDARKSDAALNTSWFGTNSAAWRGARRRFDISTH